MSHYFSKKQDSKLKTKIIEVRIKNITEKVQLATGTFSAKKLDKGTLVLAENMLINNNDKVLDLGCGVGIVGLIASHLTNNKVILTDINKRAVNIAKKNTQHKKNIKVVQGNMYESVKNEKFDVILLNPPQAAGKIICTEMITESIKYLKPNGTLQLIARHNKGGKTFEKIMKDTFNNMNYLAKSGGYRLYCSKKN